MRRTEKVGVSLLGRGAMGTLLVVLALLGAGTVAVAQQALNASPLSAGSIPWSSLTADQRRTLEPLRREWGSIDVARQRKWLEIAVRFPRMPAEERQRVQQRMIEWSHMTPQERSNARVNFQEARQLSPENRQGRWQSYQALPPEQRRRFAERLAPSKASTDAARAAETPGDVRGLKSNIVRNAGATIPAKAVSPGLVRPGSGATTTLVSKQRANPPLHQQAGLPKIAATPGFVDSTTLLPKRGAQAAAIRPAPPASAANASAVRRR